MLGKGQDNSQKPGKLHHLHNMTTFRLHSLVLFASELPRSLTYVLIASGDPTSRKIGHKTADYLALASQWGRLLYQEYMNSEVGTHVSQARQTDKLNVEVHDYTTCRSIAHVFG